jgi:hypothetical protein
MEPIVLPTEVYELGIELRRVVLFDYYNNRPR